MPIRLKAPTTYKPGGPDGKGWNRLSLCAHMGQPADQCALQPRTWQTLSESRRDTQLSQWGSYGRCTFDGPCEECPLLTAKPLTFGAFTEQVMVRIMPRQFVDELHFMNKPEDGWASFSYRCTWEDLARLVGWRIGRPFRDEHSEGFWLVKENPASHDGRPSPCPHDFVNPDHCRHCRIG
jgi:hypothetical protein